MRTRGRNGRATGVDGKQRNRVTKEEFARCAFDCNGDIKKMAEESNLNQSPAQVKQRYINLVSKGFQLGNKSLPTMIYESTGRTRITITTPMLIDLAKKWNQTGGDVDKVAEHMGGCSTATILAKVRMLDDAYYDIHKKKLIDQFIAENEGITDKEAEELAEDKINEEGFPSALCDKKEGGGNSGSKLDPSIIDSITALLDTIQVPETKDDTLSIQDVIDDISAGANEA
jgi:hypothetical protein